MRITLIAADRDVHYLHVVSDWDRSNDGALTTFRRDDGTSKLTFVESITDPDDLYELDMVRAIAVSPEGRNVYTGSTGLSTLSVFQRDRLGRLACVQRMQDDTGGVDGIHATSAICLTPDGKFLFAAGSSDNAIAVFRRAPNTGLLEFLCALKNGQNSIDSLRHVNSLVVSPDGKHLYAGSSGAAVTVFEIRPDGS
jgi:6-phosphogluconolactonase (cycloisomerase 2 family)